MAPKRRKLKRRSLSGSPRQRARRVDLADQHQRQQPPSTNTARHTKFYVSLAVVTYGHGMQCYEYVGQHEFAKEAALAAFVRMPPVEARLVYPIITVSQRGYYHLSERSFSDSTPADNVTCFEVCDLRRILGMPQTQFGITP